MRVAKLSLTTIPDFPLHVLRHPQPLELPDVGDRVGHSHHLKHISVCRCVKNCLQGYALVLILILMQEKVSQLSIEAPCKLYTVCPKLAAFLDPLPLLCGRHRWKPLASDAQGD